MGNESAASCGSTLCSFDCYRRVVIVANGALYLSSGFEILFPIEMHSDDCSESDCTRVDSLTRCAEDLDGR